MSLKASSWASVQLPAGSEDTSAAVEKNVLMVLGDQHVSETDKCCVAAGTLGKVCQLHERTVRRAMDSLQAQGFIWQQKRDRRPAQVFFNWERPGAFCWTCKCGPCECQESAGSVPVEEKEDAAKPAWVRAPEGQKTAAGSVPVRKKSAGSGPVEKKSAGNDDKDPTDCGQPLHPSAGSVPVSAGSGPVEKKSAGSVPDIPFNNNNIIRLTPNWWPRDEDLESLPRDIGSNFIADRVKDFLDYWLDPARRSKERTPDQWGESFRNHVLTNWKFKRDRETDPKPQSHGTGNAVSEPDSTEDRLRHARKMLAGIGDKNPSLAEYWQAEIDRLEQLETTT